MSPSSKRGGQASQPARSSRPARPSPPAKPAAAPAPPSATAEGTDEELAPVAPVTGRFGRLGAGAGVAYAIVGYIGSTLLPIGKVDPTDSAAAIARELVADRGRVSAGILLTLFSLFFFLVFLSWLYRWLREAEGEGGWLSTLALVGGVLMVAMLSVVVLLSIGTTVLESYGPDPVIARTLLTLQWQAVAIAFVPTAAFVGGTGLVGYTTGALPRWIVYSGLAIGATLLIPPLAFLPFLLSSLWIGMLAVVLLQRSRLGL